jgi:hypothetical protein
VVEIRFSGKPEPLQGIVFEAMELLHFNFGGRGGFANGKSKTPAAALGAVCLALRTSNPAPQPVA